LQEEVLAEELFPVIVMQVVIQELAVLYVAESVKLV
tara:strand:- start:1 stop:108 length:108 start_codon:yes stop_codon:yes gene_type:complete